MNKTEERATKLIDTPKCLLVGNVPEGSSFFIDHVFNTLCFRVYVNFKEVPYGEDVKLPPGSYGQPILASEITVEKWSEIIPDYSSPKSPDYMLRFNLQPSNTVVIPKTLTHA